MTSFDALYEAHGARIFRFCYRLCGSREMAEDLTQDVFVVAFQGLARFAGRSSEQTWLYRIALYRWNRVRKTAGPKSVPLIEADEPTLASPFDRLALDDALDSLPPKLREAFLLVKAEGLTHREAAAVLRVPPGTVQSRVFQAIRRLRTLLQEDSTPQETVVSHAPTF